MTSGLKRLDEKDVGLEGDPRPSRGPTKVSYGRPGRCDGTTGVVRGVVGEGSWVQLTRETKDDLEKGHVVKVRFDRVSSEKVNVPSFHTDSVTQSPRF